jgi:hypothetical protein
VGIRNDRSLMAEGKLAGILLPAIGAIALISPPAAQILVPLAGLFAGTWVARYFTQVTRHEPPRPKDLLTRTGWSGWKGLASASSRHFGIPMPGWRRPGTISCHWTDPVSNSIGSGAHVRFADAMEVGAGLVHLTTSRRDLDGFVDVASRSGRIDDLHIVDMQEAGTFLDRIDLLSDEDVRAGVLVAAGITPLGLKLDAVVRFHALGAGLPTVAEGARIVSLQALQDVVDSDLDGPHPFRITELEMAVAQYHSALPGFRSDRGAEQPASVRTLHQETADRLLSVLDGVRAHAGSPAEVEVRLADVVKDRLLLVVVLPEADDISKIVCDAVLDSVRSLNGTWGRPLLLSFEDIDPPAGIRDILENTAVVLTRTHAADESGNPPYPALPQIDQALFYAGTEPGHALGPAFDPAVVEKLEDDLVLVVERGKVTVCHPCILPPTVRRPSLAGWRGRFLRKGAST